MNRTPVSSTNIRSIGFDKGVLEIEFVNGKIYQYTGPGIEELYRRMLTASSMGRFFEHEIARNKALKAVKVPNG